MASSGGCVYSAVHLESLLAWGYCGGNPRFAKKPLRLGLLIGKPTRRVVR